MELTEQEINQLKYEIMERMIHLIMRCDYGVEVIEAAYISVLAAGRELVGEG